MNWAWASSLDHLWHSPSLAMWVTLAAGGFVALLLLVALLRAGKTAANGALAVIALLVVGIATTVAIGGFGRGGSRASGPVQASPGAATLPALSCIDDLAGETVLTACEKALFGSAESTAAAIAYAASLITRLTSLGDAATVNRNLTPEVEALRRAVERDRYGLMAYVLAARDHCTPQACPAFRSLGNSRQIMTNMNDRVYEGLVMRYSASWGAPATLPAFSALPPGAMASLPPPVGASAPTGKPTTMIDFPSASSTPPVNIMTPEPGGPGSAAPAARPGSPPAGAPVPLARPGTAPATAGAPPPAAKKQAPPKSARAPTPLTPPSSPPSAPAPANDDN